MLCIAIISVLKAIAWLYILFFDRREQVSIDLEKYKKEKERLRPALFFCVSFISLLYFRFNFFYHITGSPGVRPGYSTRGIPVPLFICD